MRSTENQTDLDLPMSSINIHCPCLPRKECTNGMFKTKFEQNINTYVSTIKVSIGSFYFYILIFFFHVITNTKCLDLISKTDYTYLPFPSYFISYRWKHNITNIGTSKSSTLYERKREREKKPNISPPPKKKSYQDMYYYVF